MSCNITVSIRKGLYAGNPIWDNSLYKHRAQYKAYTSYVCTYISHTTSPCWVILHISPYTNIHQVQQYRAYTSVCFQSTCKSILSCWVQNEVDEVVWCFDSSEVHLLPQSCRSLILLLPLYNQLTLRQQTIMCGSPRKKLNITSLHISIVLQHSKQKLY